MKLRKGDKIIVIAGKDKGREGKIDRLLKKKQAVLVPGLNMYKKHVKKTEKSDGGIIEFAKPINIAKVALVCPQCGKKTRAGYTFIDKEKKRICKKCNKVI